MIGTCHEGHLVRRHHRVSYARPDNPILRWPVRQAAKDSEDLRLRCLCLQRENQMQQDLAAMIVHDVKTPLGIILASLELLATDLGEGLSEEQRDLVQSAVRSGQQILELVTELLEIQRLEAGTMSLYLEPLDMAHTLKTAARRVQPLADYRAVTLLLRISDTLPWVLGDAGLISRIVTNLLDNAISFTPAGGQIVVDGQAEETGLTITVTDSGPGIPADQKEHVFDKFYQVSQGSHRGLRGVGLGLAFCKLAVEAQRGRIWVESTLGSGCQFKFSLPVQHDTIRF